MVMLVEAVFTAVFIPFSAYYLWRYFFGYKKINVVISCVDDSLRRAVTTRIVDSKSDDGEWPVRLIGGILYKCRFGWDEYKVLELNSYPQRFHDFMENVKVIIFIIDSAQSEQDQKDSVELFALLTTYEVLKNAHLLIYTLKRDPKSESEQISDEEIKEIYELERISQKWHIQPLAVPMFIGLKEGINWIRKEMK
ncbi:hypothetical protein PRIPAC_94653 [Pristionchus pacificus]|uniref:ADP ribosylation factor n=1 Tax=Pristionchus pacificus TaxID=54126 RepID=A0A2A6BBJ9_PRIPA|nr:hypothetical protein PRIPAC_94653 [Pristionchus pacificus]|eukprot:PDM63258.1 ADP ribosylation factor [Pristionchus pacificus]